MNPKPVSFILVALFTVVLWLATTAPAPTQAATAVPLPDDPPLGLTWEFSTLDSAGDVGSQLSMAIQPTTGIPHIAYYSAENGLKLAARTGNGNCGPQNSWNCQLIAPHSSGQFDFTGRYPALDFRSDGLLGVVYQQESNGWRTVRSYSPPNNFYTWIVSTDPLRTATGAPNALVYGYQDQFHIWSPQQEGNDYRLLYFGASDINWSSMRTTAIAADRGVWGNASVAHASYQTDVQPSIYYAEQRFDSQGNCYNNQWDCHHVSMVSGSLVPDKSQILLGLALYQRQCFLGTGPICDIPTTLVSYSRDSGSVHLAEKIGGTDNRCYNGDPINPNPDWRCSILQLSAGAGYSPSGWLGLAGNYWPMGIDIVLYEEQLLIFYQRFAHTGAQVMMAYKAAELGTGSGCSDSDWHCVVVDDGARGGGFVSVGFGLQAEVLPDGRILLAYHDLSNRDLIIAETVLPPTAVYLPLVLK